MQLGEVLVLVQVLVEVAVDCSAYRLPLPPGEGDRSDSTQQYSHDTTSMYKYPYLALSPDMPCNPRSSRSRAAPWPAATASRLAPINRLCAETS